MFKGAESALAPQVKRVEITADHGGFGLRAVLSQSLRAGLIHDAFSAHQNVEDDDMNVLCLSGKVIGSRLALELGRNLSIRSLQRSPSPPTSFGKNTST
jgi:ribose 5-phosphate isomerase B